MTLRSMTGYGRGECRRNGIHAVAEAGSVNRRQLDLQISLPRPLQGLESRVQEEVAERVSRGRVTLTITVRAAVGTGARRVHMDAELAAAWVRTLRDAARRLGLRDDVGVGSLLALPDVFTVEHPEENPERAWPAVRAALRRALDALVAMREREGRALAKDLAARLQTLDRMTATIAARAPGVIERHRSALLARLERAGLPLSAEDPAITREIALFADRSDISEELTRLRSHLEQGRRMLRQREPMGRALDFLTQELLREINTLAAKCADAEIAAITVQFKAELERIREQVQNVE